MSFHRSSIQLIAPQVSLIPEEYSARWSKDRRFQLTWKLLKRIRPSRILTSSTATSAGDATSEAGASRGNDPLNRAKSSASGSTSSSSVVQISTDIRNTKSNSKAIQQVYEALMKGEHVTYLLEYVKNTKQ